MLPVTNRGSGPHNRLVNPRNNRLSLPLGGVDRDAGIFRTGRGDTRDLRNVLLRNGVIHLRAGFTNTVEFPVEVDVLAMKYLPFEDVMMVVTIDGEGQVAIYKVAFLAATPIFVQNWFVWTLEGRPVVTLAHMYRLVFFAHDEPSLQTRAPTFVYDGEDGSFSPLLATDWAGESEFEGVPDFYVRFRGVVAYLDYMVGWGFGNSTDDRSEFVRLSMPGEPDVFKSEHWVSAGSRGDPVITCAPAGNGLLIMKATESYPLLGTSPQTFGVGPAVDLKFGCVGVNLWTNLNGALYVWSAEGPRVTTGGPLQDLALPLDLDGPALNELSREQVRTGFATYVPEKRIVLFVFGDWAYALDVRGGAPGGWSYWTLGYEVGASGIWYLPSEGAGISPGEVPAGPYFYQLEGATDTTLRLLVRNPTSPPNHGTEYIQTFYRKNNAEDVYHFAASAQRVAGAAGATVRIVVRGLEPDTEYRLAFRYELLGTANENYPGATNAPGLLPDGWPALSTTVQSTTESQDLTLSWERTGLPPGNEQVNVAWVVPALEQSGTLRYGEKSVGSGTPSWEIEENALPQSPAEWTYAVKTAENEDEEYLRFRVRVITASVGPTGIIWTGPPATALMSTTLYLTGDLIATFQTPPNAGKPLMDINYTFNLGEYGELLSVDKQARAYTRVTQESTNGPMAAEFEWEEYYEEALTAEWSDGPYRPSHLEIRGMMGVIVSEALGHYVPPPFPPEDEGQIKSGRDYRVRCRTVQVYPSEFDIDDYIEDPTGKCLDYSDWSSWTHLVRA